MKQQANLLRVQSPGDELVIRDFKRIKRIEESHMGLIDGTAGWILSESREVFIDAWSGKTGEGHPVHISYRIGELTVEIDLPTPDGGRQPLRVLRWKPRLALGLAIHTYKKDGWDTAGSREERVRMAEAGAELAEVRALNSGKRRILSEGELLGWFEDHNRHFEFLSQRGLAGGRLRFRIQRAERLPGEA